MIMDPNNGNNGSSTSSSFVSSWSSSTSFSHKHKKSVSTILKISSLQTQQDNSNKLITIPTKSPSTSQSFITQITFTTMLWLMAFFIPMNINNMIMPTIAYAEETSKIVGQLKGSGLFFKDTLEIESFDDPKVKGVKLYVSTFQIPLTEKLSAKNLFSDPSYASLTCTRINNIPIRIADNINKSLNGEEVFEEKKSLLFKDLRVYRVYDTSTNTIVYVSYNTRFDKNDDTNKSRFKSSLCAINLNDPIIASTTESSPSAAAVADTK